MAARSICKLAVARQPQTFEFSTSPIRRIDGLKPCPRRKFRWLRFLAGFLFGVLFTASLLGNFYQNRRWIRDRIIEQLKPDQPVIRFADHERGNPVAVVLAQMRQEQAQGQREMSAEVKSMRELLELFKSVEFERLRYDFEQVRNRLEETENSLRGLRQGMGLIRGELIRKEVIPKEYSTAF